MPWIQISITEDDICDMFEVFLGVSASELIQSPVVLGSQAITFNAALGVFFFVPGLSRQEHV